VSANKTVTLIVIVFCLSNQRVLATDLSSYDFPQADLIGIGAAVTHPPLSHHGAYGSVHGGSSWLR
jgi:hypothetical protein